MRDFLCKRLAINQIIEIVNDKSVNKIKIISGSSKVSELNTTNEEVKLILYEPSMMRAKERYAEIKKCVPSNVVVEIEKIKITSHASKERRKNRLKTQMEHGNGSNGNRGKSFSSRCGLEIDPGIGTDIGNCRTRRRAAKIAHRRRIENGKTNK